MCGRYLIQLINVSIREDVLLDLLYTNREGLGSDVVVGGCLGLSDHEMLKFSILNSHSSKEWDY